ncbi:hypothetical protein D3C83_224060 [compost metagenome]
MAKTGGKLREDVLRKTGVEIHQHQANGCSRMLGEQRRRLVGRTQLGLLFQRGVLRVERALWRQK